MTPTTFIARWKRASGTELANAQLFATELCEVLDLPRPNPAEADDAANSYVFERPVTFRHGDGSSSSGRIDCYRRDAFILEAKKIRDGRKQGYDEAMLAARNQAENYARAIPAAEGRPPFLILVDIGFRFEIYAEFSRSGATYTPFPAPGAHRFELADLEKEEFRALLKAIWLKPLELDPARKSARVTREVAANLAKVAASLEKDGHASEDVSAFLSRCLFCMFAEDVGLLPLHHFEKLLLKWVDDPAKLQFKLAQLWADMDKGSDFSQVFDCAIRKFNGSFFKNPSVLPLSKEQVEILYAAAHADWRQVEPAIFGTLLERALDPAERHALGAHYTPRAYVERLVLPAVIEPLREEWDAVRAAAFLHLEQKEVLAALTELQAFRSRLAQTTVLDPACGSGNFLYVTLEHFKRLEAEILDLIERIHHDFPDVKTPSPLLGIGGDAVDPHQFLGLEINSRAAALAELVLWIGHLQWQYKLKPDAPFYPSPVLRDFKNIQNRDAVLSYDSKELLLDPENGKPLMRWDGLSRKLHPVTAQLVPDESKQIPLYTYSKPRRAEWPQADFIVGNPPFIGGATMRAALGDGYCDSLRLAWKEVPESADFVMYWWHQAAESVRAGKSRRFGFITTNSIKQTFNRRVLEAQMRPPLGARVSTRALKNEEAHVDMRAPRELHLAFAIPDHPWVDAAEGAAVRIAMSVGTLDPRPGKLLCISSEEDHGDAEGYKIELRSTQAHIHPDLSTGADVTQAKALVGNQEVSTPGVKLHGDGFIITEEEALSLGLGEIEGAEKHLRAYRNGKDLAQRPRGVRVIDLFGLDEREVRHQFPAIYQHVLYRVKPERDLNNMASRKKFWWIFGGPNPGLRKMLDGLTRYIATVETTKHRIFQFLDQDILPDNKLVNIAIADAAKLAILSSSAHVLWSLATGSRLGVGNDPVYVKTKCFECFPFPPAGPCEERLRELGEELDATRKKQQEAHPELTLTGMYNVLEKLRSGDELSAKEKKIHDLGLVSLLLQLHDEIDALTLKAYGWDDLIGQRGEVFEQEILSRLAALNAERLEEEAAGKIRYLRPEFQLRAQAGSPGVLPGDAEEDATDANKPAGSRRSQGAKKPKAAAPKTPKAPIIRAWPSTLPEQIKQVGEVIARSGAPLTPEELAAKFTGRGPWKSRLPQILDILESLGKIRRLIDGRVGG